MPKRTKSYHAWLIKSLTDPSEAEAYLNVALEDSPEQFLKALRNVAEAHKMSKVAQEAGITREGLYKTLSDEGNPRFDTLSSVLLATGLQLAVKRKDAEMSTPAASGGSGASATTKGIALVYVLNTVKPGQETAPIINWSSRLFEDTKRYTQELD